jgi:hypothetical protein
VIWHNPAVYHSDIFPTDCTGIVVLDGERSTALVTVARCSRCQTEFQWEPESECVTIVATHALGN